MRAAAKPEEAIKAEEQQGMIKESVKMQAADEAADSTGILRLLLCFLQ